MLFGERDVKRLTIIVLVGLLLISVFFLIRPIITAILGGLILAYVFNPLYQRLRSWVKNRTLAASLVVFIILIILLAVFWFLTPLIMKQVFEIFEYSQKLDVNHFIQTIFPAVSQQFIAQMSSAIHTIIGKVSSSILNSLLDLLLDLPRIVLDLFIIGFIFFFALRDGDRLVAFFKSLSPFTEDKEKIIVKHFRDVTNSVIYGQVIVGIMQGCLAGIGFLVFGIKGAVVLTLLAVFFSIIPFVGPSIIWIPVSIYLFSSGNIGLAFGYLAYNIFIVSVADNILRSYLISRKTNISPAVIIVGMLGGVFVFGILGLIIGPLLLAYLLTLLESFKDKTIYSLFSAP